MSVYNTYIYNIERDENLNIIISFRIYVYTILISIFFFVSISFWKENYLTKLPMKF